MKTSRLAAVLVAVAVMVLFASNASAMYNPSTGTWMQRDPGPGGMTHATPRVGGGPVTGGAFLPRDQYHDGMNLYQYCRSNPAVFIDPTGLAVSGRLMWDGVIVYGTTAAWKAVQADPDYGAQTDSDRRPSVTATYNPSSPCCCKFDIESYDYDVESQIPGVGVVYAYGATMTAALHATARLHEGYHRADHIAVWRRCKGVLTATRTCCYTRGVWIFKRGDAQSRSECDGRAKLLTEYLINQLQDYQHAVAAQIDSRVKLTSPRAAHTAAHAAATAYMATMAMRDWSCDDTLYWFYP